MPLSCPLCKQPIKHDDVFPEYIPTSKSPSTRTIGHKPCGFIYNFDIPATKVELKVYVAWRARAAGCSEDEVAKVLGRLERYFGRYRNSRSESVARGLHQSFDEFLLFAIRQAKQGTDQDGSCAVATVTPSRMEFLPSLGDVAIVLIKEPIVEYAEPGRGCFPEDPGVPR